MAERTYAWIMRAGSYEERGTIYGVFSSIEAAESMLSARYGGKQVNRKTHAADLVDLDCGQTVYDLERFEVDGATP